LGCNGAERKIKLTTIGESQDVTTVMLNDLEVTDVDENNTIPLSEVLCRPNIPVSKDEIPTQEDVDRWRYLCGYVHLHNINSEVELLIGANIPEALQKLGNALHDCFFMRIQISIKRCLEMTFNS
jgi:predicted glycosyltransferase